MIAKVCLPNFRFIKKFSITDMYLVRALTENLLEDIHSSSKRKQSTQLQMNSMRTKS